MDQIVQNGAAMAANETAATIRCFMTPPLYLPGLIAALPAFRNAVHTG